MISVPNAKILRSVLEVVSRKGRVADVRVVDSAYSGSWNVFSGANFSQNDADIALYDSSFSKRFRSLLIQLRPLSHVSQIVQINLSPTSRPDPNGF